MKLINEIQLQNIVRKVAEVDPATQRSLPYRVQAINGVWLLLTLNRSKATWTNDSHKINTSSYRRIELITFSNQIEDKIPDSR